MPNENRGWGRGGTSSGTGRNDDSKGETGRYNKPGMRIPLKILDREIARLQRRKDWHGLLRNTLMILVVIAAGAIIVSNLWLSVLVVDGDSMNPGLEQGDAVLTVHTATVRHNQIIAFYYGSKILIKRVIATGGETVNIGKNGIVYVNGSELNEPYVSAPSLGNCDIQLPYKVPAGDVFVLGDNRPTSEDSRLTIIGPVTGSQIIGKVIFRIWPFTRIGPAD